jgi:hypothetical protein
MNALARINVVLISADLWLMIVYLLCSVAS